MKLMTILLFHSIISINQKSDSLSFDVLSSLISLSFPIYSYLYKGLKVKQGKVIEHAQGAEVVRCSKERKVLLFVYYSVLIFKFID